MTRKNNLLRCVLFSHAVLLAPAAFGGLILNTPIDVLGALPASTFAANGYATNSYKDWGNEPSIAVNPLNTNQIVISSFSYGTSSKTAGADLFYSTNGGVSWTSNFSVPAPVNGVSTPNDWRFAYDSAGTLHANILGCAGNNCNIYAGTTNNPASLAAWSYTGGGTPINSAASINNADQPWIAVASGNKVFAAYDDFHLGTDVRVAASSNNGASFTVDKSMINGPVSGNTVNPGNRIATDGNGVVYGIYGFGPSVPGLEGVHNVTYYINRSRDGGNTWDFLANSAVGGIQVGNGISDQLDNPGTQSTNNWFAHVNDLRGNYTAIAADITGSHIYAIWGKRDASNVDRIYMTEYHPGPGNTLLASSPLVVSVAGEWAALPSVTVLADGTVAILYDSYSAFDGKVHVHVASSEDFGASIASDVDTYSFTPLSLAAATGSTTRNREFGDYQFITSVGNSLYGTFVARGNNAGVNNTSGLIDPFFFSGTSVSIMLTPEPTTLSLIAGAFLAGFAWRKRSEM